ncbi:hypothetical protein ACIBSV_07915 [Embleya sp. NPDC050154]|uniref:hypothetical protein n=1 Tax=Embleya sp. NPDC050154 TaxID=3363988 RepID=UPI0037A449C3
MGHVLVRLTGFDVTLVPYWPYTFERASAAGEGAVRVTKWEGSVPLSALVTPSAGTPDIALNNARSTDEVVDVLPGPAHRNWRIETSPYSVAWPEGFTIEPSDQGAMPFFLLGPHDAAIYIQGPSSHEHMPPLTEFVGPGQTIVDHRRARGCEVVEVAYHHEGVDWRQTHRLVALSPTMSLVVTAQSPATQAREVSLAGERVALSVTPRADA